MNAAVAVTIAFNLAIALSCLYVAVQIVGIGRHLGRAAEALLAADRATHRVLNGAPTRIDRGRQGTRSLRRTGRFLGRSLRKVRQVGMLLATALRWLRK